MAFPNLPCIFSGNSAGPRRVSGGGTWGLGMHPAHMRRPQRPPRPGAGEAGLSKCTEFRMRFLLGFQMATSHRPQARESRPHVSPSTHMGLPSMAHGSHQPSLETVMWALLTTKPRALTLPPPHLIHNWTGRARSPRASQVQGPQLNEPCHTGASHPQCRLGNARDQPQEAVTGSFLFLSTGLE